MVSLKTLENNHLHSLKLVPLITIAKKLFRNSKFPYNFLNFYYRLCYGLEEAMRRFVALLVLENFSSTNGGTGITADLQNPCVKPLNGRDTWLVDFMSTKGDIFQPTCTQVTMEELSIVGHIMPSCLFSDERP